MGDLRIEEESQNVEMRSQSWT